MSKFDVLLQSFIDISTASEISHATLEELMDNSEDDREKYIILGVLQQLEKIKKATENIDKAMSGEDVA